MSRFSLTTIFSGEVAADAQAMKGTASLGEMGDRHLEREEGEVGGRPMTAQRLPQRQRHCERHPPVAQVAVPRTVSPFHSLAHQIQGRLVRLQLAGCRNRVV